MEGLLEAFADPAFQILLGEAQKRAAATERECDYNLLSELLVAHVQKGQNRTQKAGINRAVEIVSDIDSQALCALTVSHAVLAFSPVTGVTYDGLKVLDGLFNKLIYDELPSGKSWLDHLDVLGAIRWSTIGNMKKFREYYTSRLDGYSCAGIKRSSDDYQKAVDILAKANISSKLLVDNECLDGYVRLNLNSKRSIPTLAFFLDSQPIPLTSVQIDAVNNVWNLYTKEVQAKQDARDNFMKLLSSFDELVELEQWWDKIPGTFHVSQVGCVLAHTNAKRCDPRIPDLI